MHKNHIFLRLIIICSILFLGLFSAGCANCISPIPFQKKPEEEADQQKADNISQTLSFQNSNSATQSTDDPRIIIKLVFSKDVSGITHAPTQVSTDLGTHTIVWTKIDNRNYEGVIDLSHKAQDQTISLTIPSSGNITSSNKIEINYKTKYKQYSFGLEFELKRSGGGKITKRMAPLGAKTPLNEKKILAKSQDGPKGLPLIKLVTDDANNNEVCIEVVSGAMAFGFNTGDEDEKKVLRFKKALNLLIDSIEALRYVAPNPPAPRGPPIPIMPLSNIIDHYNNLLLADNDQGIRDYHLNLEVNADGSLFFIEGHFNKNFPRTPQVNWAFPTSRMGEVKPGAADLNDPTYFSDMFGQSQQGSAYTFRRENLARFQEASRLVVDELSANVLAGADQEEKKKIRGAFLALLWETLNKSYRQCALDMLTFGQAQDQANPAVTPPLFRADRIAPPAKPGWGNVTNAMLATVPWVNFSALPVFNSFNSLGHGAGKNIYDNLAKACLEDIADKSIPELYKQPLQLWWQANGVNRFKHHVLQGDPPPGFTRGFADNAPTGAQISMHTGQLTATTIFNYCDNWLFAMIADAPYNQVAHKANADAAMWGYFDEKLRDFGAKFFHYRNPGHNTCTMGTSRDSEIPIENLGENGAQPTVVFELRNTHPLDQFDYSGNDQSWSDTLIKWRRLLEIPTS